jgi:CRISPR-associated protein Csb1
VADQLTLDALRDAVRGTAAAFRCRARLQPIGDGDKVFPPTYAGGVYATEDRRIDGHVVRCVLLDSVQSQANRMEEVLQEAFLPNWRELPRDGDTICGLPLVAVHVGKHGWITSLTAPHRIHDAILRDSSDGTGTRFRDSLIGQQIRDARLHNATAFYRYCPTALLFGTWDSTSGEGLDSAKIPRAVVSEIVGVDYTPGVATASRLDPLGIKKESATIYRRRDKGWAFQESDGSWVGAQPEDLERDAADKPKRFGKDGKPSDINHGNVTPDVNRFGDFQEVRKQHLEQLPDILKSEQGKPVAIKAFAVRPGGVTIAHALNTWTLSVTQLRRLRFPVDGHPDEDRNVRVRTVLAALSIYALALQRERGYWLRSRCELIAEAGAVLTQLHTDGTDSNFDVPNLEAARQLFEAARRDAEEREENGIQWHPTVIRLTPIEQLRRLVELSDELSPGEADVDDGQVQDVGD